MGLFKVFTLFLWILSIFCALFFAVFAAEYNRIITFKEPVSNKALEGYVMRRETVTNDGSCRVKCYLEPNCVSINVGPREGENHICELNKATDESPSYSTLATKRHYTYYAIENPCHSNPCPGKHAVCQVGFTDKGFRCVCQEGYEKNKCKQDCHKALGMENGDISDTQISASSEWDMHHGPKRGRLHIKRTGSDRGSWSASQNNANQWIQVDLIGQLTRVTGIATQGRYSQNDIYQWVTSYNLQHSNDGVSFQYYTEQGVKKVFNGNTDRDTVVYHDLRPPVIARFIRVRPLTWHKHISMRVELYSCEDFIPSTDALCDSCYALFTLPETWNNARRKCEDLGAQLVKIESAIENDFLKRTFLTSVGTSQIAYWIGLSDQREEGTWEWTDGSLLGNYTNWEKNNPNNLNGNQNCAHIAQGTFNMHGFRFNGFDAGWNDFRCDFTLGYICERVSP